MKVFRMKKIGETLLAAAKERKAKKERYEELERRIMARKAREQYEKQVWEERRIRLSLGLREELRTMIQAEIDKQLKQPM